MVQNMTIVNCHVLFSMLLLCIFDFAEINILTICPFGKVPKIKGKKILALAAFSRPWKGLEKAARGSNGGRRIKLHPGSARASEARTAAGTGG